MFVGHDREEYSIPGLCPPLSHYVDAVRFGNLVFVSGVCAADPDGKVIEPDDVVKQAEFVFSGISKVLDAVKAEFKDILRVNVYLTDVNDRQAVDAVRRKYFGAHRPASTLIGVNALALEGLKVEVDAIVGLPG